MKPYRDMIKTGLALMVGAALICIICLIISLPLYLVCVLWNSLLGWI